MRREFVNRVRFVKNLTSLKASVLCESQGEANKQGMLILDNIVFEK